MLYLFLTRLSQAVVLLALVGLPTLATAEDNELSEEAMALLSGQLIASSDPNDLIPKEQPPQELNMDVNRVLVKVGETEIRLGHVLVEAMLYPEIAEQVEIGELFAHYLYQVTQKEVISQTIPSIPVIAQFQADNERRSLMVMHHLEMIEEAIEVPEADIQSAFEEKYADLIPKQEFNASHILLDDLQDAISIISSLANGDDFGQLARTRSVGPSGPSGGNLGWFGPGRMVPEFEAAVRELEVGQISAPIETEFGWHVIRLNDTRIPDTPGFEDVEATLREEIALELFKKAVSDLIDSVTVEPLDLSGIDPAVLKDPTKAF